MWPCIIWSRYYHVNERTGATAWETPTIDMAGASYIDTVLPDSAEVGQAATHMVALQAGYQVGSLSLSLSLLCENE
jgi:hypothetical protein